MRPIVTDVAYVVCVSVCLLVTTVSPAKPDEAIDVLFGIYMWTRVARVGIPQGKGQFWENISLPVVKHREDAAGGRYSQPCSVGGSSDAAFRSQCCSNSLFEYPLFSVSGRNLSQVSISAAVLQRTLVACCILSIFEASKFTACYFLN